VEPVRVLEEPYFLVVFLVAVFFVAAAFFTPGFS